MVRESIKEKVWWYIYIIDVDNRGKKSEFYGLDKIYYTGITTDLGRRIGDYLYKRGKEGFLNKLWKDARLIPVYVGYFYGTEEEAMRIEKSIKKATRERKERLINSVDFNKLVGYKPTKHLILKKCMLDGETIIKIR